MGGGGFIKHASDTNQRDRSQKMERRSRYEKSHPDNTILKNAITKLDFSHLTAEQIEAERKKIRENYQKHKRRNMVIFIVSLAIALLLLLILYSRLAIIM